jgi:hypothetical protein
MQFRRLERYEGYCACKKESNKDIKPCRAKIVDEHKKLYKQLGCKSSKKRDRSKECIQEVNRSISQQNTTQKQLRFLSDSVDAVSNGGSGNTVERVRIKLFTNVP